MKIFIGILKKKPKINWTVWWWICEKIDVKINFFFGKLIKLNDYGNMWVWEKCCFVELDIFKGFKVGLFLG